jgi:hypothetical protein
VENGKVEVSLWFSPVELVEWSREVDRWILE